MAFSTQKYFMTLDPIDKRGTKKNRRQYNTGIKHYGSCLDARAWSSDDTERNLYLSELISCQQDFCCENCTPDCNSHIDSDLEKSINSQDLSQSHQNGEGDTQNRGSTSGSEHVGKKRPLYKQESSLSASSRLSKDEDNPNRPIFGPEGLNNGDSIIAANENLPASSVNSVEDSKSEKINAKESMFGKDLEIDESTLEFILINELVKGRKSTQASFVHGPSGLRPTLTSATGRGDCQNNRGNIRQMIESKGEETLAEIMKLLNRYQSRVQYYMTICKGQQCQTGKADTPNRRFKLSEQITPVNRRIPDVGESSKKKPEVQFSFIHDRAQRNQRSDHTTTNLSHKLHYASNTSFPATSASNIMNQSSSETSSHKDPEETPPPNRKHKHSDLFFHERNSMLSFNNTKNALATIDRQQGLLNSLDMYSDELDGAMKTLGRVLGEFAQLKSLIGKLLNVGEPVPDYVRPESINAPGPSQRAHSTANVNFRFPRDSLVIQGPGRNIRHFKRSSAGAECECDRLICEAQQDQLANRCRQTIREIHKELNNQFNAMKTTPEIKNKFLKMLNLQCESLQKFDQYNQAILSRSKKIRDSLLNIESVVEDVRVTGFARYSMKSGRSKNVHSKSIISLLRRDFSVQVDIAKIPMNSVDAIGRIDKMLSARLAKLKSELEVIAKKFADTKKEVDSSLPSRNKALKESAAIERKVVKRCRQIKALEQKVLKVKNVLSGKSTTACHSHDQYCAKRTLKRIKALQKNLLEVSATAELKKHMLHLSVAAESRTQKQNQRLKKDVMEALKIAHDLEGHINALKYAICGQMLNSGETTSCNKKVSHTASPISSRQSAVIVKPQPSADLNSGDTEIPAISSAERLADAENLQLQSNNPDIESCSETLLESDAPSDAPSHIYQRSSDVEQVNKFSSQTSIIEVEIPPSINYQMQEMQSITTITSPTEMRTSISTAMVFSKPVCTKPRNEENSNSIIVTLEPRNIIETPPTSLERNISKSSIVDDDDQQKYSMETQTTHKRISEGNCETSYMRATNSDPQEPYQNHDFMGFDGAFCQANGGHANASPYLMFPNDGYLLENELDPSEKLQQKDPVTLIDILNDKNYVNFNIGAATPSLENPTALYQLLAEPIIQGAVDILTTDWIKEVNDLRLGFSSLKAEFQRLQQNELVYQSKIKSLEADLYAASQTVQHLHETQDAFKKSIDNTELPHKTQVAEDRTKQLPSLLNSKSEDLERERIRNIEFQQSIRNLRAELKKCQQELHCLHAIHRNCSAVASPPKDEFQTKWIHDLEALRVETEVLRQELKEKDEELKEWQAGYLTLVKAQTNRDSNTKWESHHIERSSQKLGGPSKSIRRVFEANHKSTSENTDTFHRFDLTAEDNGHLRQRLVETLQRLDEEKKITSRLRQELQANFRETHISDEDSESHQTVQDFELTPFLRKSPDSLQTACNQNRNLQQIIEKQRSTMHYLSKLQSSVRGLLDRLTFVLRIECPKRFNLVNSKCYCDFDRIRKKVRKIYKSLQMLKEIGAFTLSSSDCTKTSRLEKICAKILQKGIHNLNWNDLAYLHAVVYKAGRVVKKLKIRTRQVQSQWDTDAMQNEETLQQAKPLKKIKKLEHDVAEARELIHMLKQECKIK